MKDIFGTRVAVITGAGSGIGRALALDLGRRGGRLALCDIDASAVEETAEMTRRDGAEATAAQLDVSDRAAFAAYGDRVLTQAEFATTAPKPKKKPRCSC